MRQITLWAVWASALFALSTLSSWHFTRNLVVVHWFLPELLVGSAVHSRIEASRPWNTSSLVLVFDSVDRVYWFEDLDIRTLLSWLFVSQLTRFEIYQCHSDYTAFRLVWPACTGLGCTLVLVLGVRSILQLCSLAHRCRSKQQVIEVCHIQISSDSRSLVFCALFVFVACGPFVSRLSISPYTIQAHLQLNRRNLASFLWLGWLGHNAKAPLPTAFEHPILKA